jgi:hypothetical protein
MIVGVMASGKNEPLDSGRLLEASGIGEGK